MRSFVLAIIKSSLGGRVISSLVPGFPKGFIDTEGPSLSSERNRQDAGHDAQGDRC